MITENTLFILGAGASCPYGYPTGRALRSYIIKGFPQEFEKILSEDSNNPAYRQAYRLLVPKSKQLSERFAKAPIASIDHFLALNPDLQDIGKIAIATCILKCEKKCDFDERKMTEEVLSQDWLFHLFQTMAKGLSSENGIEQFRNNKVAFITFNYDISLEMYFCLGYTNTFLKGQLSVIVDDLRKNCIPFPFIHVYGQIDEPFYHRAATYYGAEGLYSYISILEASKGIRIIGERADQQKEEIKSLLNWAKRIYFLGFGYDKDNMVSIGLPGPLDHDKAIFGTALGLTKGEIAKVRSFLRTNYSIAVRGLDLPNPFIEDANCYRLLREHPL